MVLTSSAGATRTPTAHRMLISAEDISDERMEVLKGGLFMSEAEILISEKGMEKFLKRAEGLTEFRTYFGLDRERENYFGVEPSKYYHFHDSVILNSFVNWKEKLDAIHLIRQYSVSPRNDKIGMSDELLALSLELERQKPEGKPEPEE